MPMWTPSRAIKLKLDIGDNSNQIQQVRSGAKTVRLSSQSPNAASIPDPVSANNPRQVRDVRVGRQTIGNSVQITVSFTRNPSDPNFTGCDVWLRGYKGNKNLTKVSSGQDSPIKFLVEKTNEPVSVHVQAIGNGGTALRAGAPVRSIQL